MSEPSKRDAPDRVWLLPNGNMTTCLVHDDPASTSAIEYRPVPTCTTEPTTEPGPYLWESRYGRVYGVTVTAFHYRPNYPPIYRFTHPDSGRELSTRNAGGKWFGPVPLPEIGG